VLLKNSCIWLRILMESEVARNLLRLYHDH
jgi:hypothetical protein